MRTGSCLGAAVLIATALAVSAASDNPLPIVSDVPAQPLLAQVKRIGEAMDHLGHPLSAETKAALEKAGQHKDDAAVIRGVQEALDPYCLLSVNINPESRVKVAAGPAKAELVENGWRQFLVKVHNEAGVTAELRGSSPQALKLAESPADDVRNRWLELRLFNSQPLAKSLCGLPLEYRIIQLYSRDAGRREAKLSFNVGQGTQDLGFRNEVDLVFDCKPSQTVTFRVLDENGQPTTAGLTIRDSQGRVYPSLAKRLAPDFAFHPQIYRHDGESLKLPAGTYAVQSMRGPEYRKGEQTIRVEDKPIDVPIRLTRWVDPSLKGWWSGDHHIHAAGCAHYSNPTEGVHAPDMMRHCLGEDLKIGCNLTWGPCFDYQKQFFTGAIDKTSKYPYLLRYDVEVSGFGSHQSGHLCLLRLKEQMFPGGDSTQHWPTLGLNTLRWAKKQGAVCGPAHSGFGLEVAPKELPNYIVPEYSGIGANEYVVDVTHMVEGPDGKPVPAVDFISTVDTPYVWELNMWYHTLNCGFRTRASGETDFPCIYGERVGIGRSYVKLDGKVDFDQWCEGIRQGRSYVTDGKSHLIDFKVNECNVGEQGSELQLKASGTVRVTAQVAALLDEKPDPTISKRRYQEMPYWSLERARIGPSREVPIEVIVNGYPVAEKRIVADGRMAEVQFDVPIERSSWVALRILPSSHTNPVFVMVGDKPIRASRRSAEWCLKGVDQCWSQKKRFIMRDEMQDAAAAYDHARMAYQRIVKECEAE